MTVGIERPLHTAGDLLLALPVSKLSRLVLSDVRPVLGPASGGTEIFIEVMPLHYAAAIFPCAMQVS